MKKYYESKEVLEIVDHPTHPEYKIVRLEGGKEVVLSPKMIVAAVTDEPVDATKLRDLRCLPVTQDILKVMLDWNIHSHEIEFLFARVTMSMNENFKQANEILWGVSDREQTMLNVHDVLLKGDKEKAIPSPLQRDDLNPDAGDREPSAA